MATVRTYGSSALNMQPAPQRERRRAYEPSPQERQRRLEQQRRREQQRRLLEAQRREAHLKAVARREVLKKVGILLYVCSLFAVLSLVIVGYAHVATIKMENNVLAKQMDTYNTQIADLQLELSQKTDLQYIRQQAQDRLSMGYPKAYQKLEIELNKSATSAATDGDTSNQSGSLKSSDSSKISNGSITSNPD